MESNVRGVPRVLEKLEKSVKDGNYYEAHQMYRTLYFRYLKQNKYSELLDMLYNGALLFLDRDQQNSGADLGILLVDVLTKSECMDYLEWTPKLSKIFAKMDSNTPERDTFLLNSIQWSSKDGIHGLPLLHQNIAQVYWNEKDYVQAKHHFLHSKDGLGCARLLIELHSIQGYSTEVDLLIAQAVLQFLCLKNKSTANQTFKSYTQQHPRIKKTGPPYFLPLLNFIWFLLQAVESRKLATFTVLCEKYELSIMRDPCYIQYLDKIGQIFFGVAAPVANSGFFGNILNYLGNLDDDSDEDTTPSMQQTPSSSRKPIENAELD